MRIALFVIATGDYIKYIYPLVDTVKDFFLTDHKVDIFVFTDQQEVPRGTIRIYCKHRPWPYPTLYRYKYIHEARHLYQGYDCYYYCDADMLFKDKVGDEVLGELVGTRHPGFFNQEKTFFPYETNKLSTAYVKDGDGMFYYAGGFNGGRRYLEMAKMLDYMVELDLYRDVIACWHDESHINRYFISNPPDVVLSPSYCYPETKKEIIDYRLQNIKGKLIALNKGK